MADALRLTAARTTLLFAVRDGLVYGDTAGDAWLDERLAAFYDPLTAGRWKVTAAVRKQVEAEWIGQGPQRKYQLTDLGREQLAIVTGGAS